MEGEGQTDLEGEMGGGEAMSGGGGGYP